MTENLKKFFKKKKLDLTFKKAGPGHRLNEDTKKYDSTPEQPVYSRVEQSAEAKQAAAAALARLQGASSNAGFGKPSLYQQVREEVRQELKSDRSNASASTSSSSRSGCSSTSVFQSTSTSSTSTTSSNSPSVICKEEEEEEEQHLIPSHLAAAGVYFRCPLIGPDVLTKREWKTKIRHYLYDQLEEEKGLTSCLIIRNCNSNPEKINACIETLSKYIQNIINNPDEEKYRKIRLSNKIFREKVGSQEGAFEFFEAVGFEKKTLPVQDESEEFLVLPKEKIEDMERIEMLADALLNAVTINLILDRNLQVLLPSQAETRTQLPDDFFRLGPEELRREQQARSASVENMTSLRTKAMREKQAQREMKKYRYALIRVRFPDGILLQGTFAVYEKFEEVHRFVKENLIKDFDFLLLTPEVGKIFSRDDFEKTLIDLHLVPATVLLFHLNTQIPENEEIVSYLKPDVTLLLQNL